MKVICAIGMQGGAEIVRRLLELIGSQHELYLLDVIDSGPRNTLEDYLHGPRHLRRPGLLYLPSESSRSTRLNKPPEGQPWRRRARKLSAPVSRFTPKFKKEGPSRLSSN
jgi:hypothetical protein